MHISDYPDNSAGCCLLTGSSEDPNGFLNLETPADPRRAIGQQLISVSYLRELGEAAGFTHPVEVERLRDEISSLKLQLAIADAERDKATDECDAALTLVGPKVWAKAQHIRKNAGFAGRQKIKAIQAFAKDEITEDEFNEKMGVTDEAEVDEAVAA